MSGGTRAPTRTPGRRPPGRPPPSARRRRAGRLPWLLVALLTVAVVVLGVLLVADEDPGAERGGTGAASRPAGGAFEEPLGRLAGAPIRVDDTPSALGVGSLTTTWVLHEGAGTLRTIDPKLNELFGVPTPIGGRPRFMTIGPGAIWVSSFNSDTVSRVNPGTGTVMDRIPVGDSPWGMALAPPDALWVANHDDDTVQRIDTETNTRVGAPIKVGEAPVSVGFGSGAVWTTNSQSDTVSRIDPRGRRLIETIPVGDHPTGIAIGDGSVWAANSEDDTVTRIDADTNRVIATIPVGDRPMFIRYGTGGLWVPNAGDGTLVRIGPDINRVADAPLELGRGIDRVAIGSEGLWISNPDADEVTRVEFIPRRAR